MFETYILIKILFSSLVGSKLLKEYKECTRFTIFMNDTNMHKITRKKLLSRWKRV